MFPAIFAEDPVSQPAAGMWNAVTRRLAVIPSIQPPNQSPFNLGIGRIQYGQQIDQSVSFSSLYKLISRWWAAGMFYPPFISRDLRFLLLHWICTDYTSCIYTIFLGSP